MKPHSPRVEEPRGKFAGGARSFSPGRRLGMARRKGAWHGTQQVDDLPCETERECKEARLLLQGDATRHCFPAVSCKHGECRPHYLTAVSAAESQDSYAIGTKGLGAANQRQRRQQR